MHGQGGGEPPPALARRPSGRLRRQHGFQPPLHPLQIVGWLTLAAFVGGSYFVLLPGLPHHAQPAAAAAVSVLFLVHLSVNLLAGLLDPAEEALRLREPKPVPILDRSKHTHVIESGYCHLCGIEVTNSRTKHCSACNKCVANFDHHCKWLNHCIGGRNYSSFLMCVSSAVAAAILIFALAVTNLVYHKSFDSDSSQGGEWQFDGNGTEDGSTLKPFNSTNNPLHSSLPSSDAAFLAIVAALGLLAAVTAGLLLHLCFFHIYISFLGLTTYEYIRQHRQNHNRATTGPEMSLQQQNGSGDEIRRVKNGSILRRRPIDLQCDGDSQTRTFFSCTVVEESFSSNCTSEPTPTPPSTPQADCQMCVMTNNSVAPETLKVPPKKVYKKWSCCLSGVPDSPDSPSEPKCLMSLCRHKAKSKKLPPVIEGRPHAHRTHGHWSSAKIRLLFRVLGNLGQNRRRNQTGQTKGNQVGSEVSGTNSVGSIQTVSNLVPVQYPDGSRRAGSLPSLQNPPRRRLISETELANALTLLQQQQQQRCGSTTRRPSYRTRRRRSVAHHRPKSPALSPIRESGLSNPASPSRQSCTVGALSGTCT